MNYNYEEFLKKERQKFPDLKRIYHHKEKVKDYWQRLGEQAMSDRAFEEWKKKILYDHTWQTNMEAIVRYGEINDGEKILDVGCGWGRILVGLRKFFPHSYLVGIDIIPQLLERAKKVIKEEIGNLDKLELLVADIDQLPFQDDTFDKVIAIRILQYVPDPYYSLNELKRVTKKGGRVVITVPNKLNPRQLFFYHTKLYGPSDVYQWFKEAHFSDIKIGSIRFLPRFKHKPRYDSKLRIIEKIGSYIPFINKLGGLIICSGKKD